MICTIGGSLKLHSNFTHDAYILRANCLGGKKSKGDISVSLKQESKIRLGRGKSHTGYRSFSL